MSETSLRELRRYGMLRGVRESLQNRVRVAGSSISAKLVPYLDGARKEAIVLGYVAGLTKEDVFRRVAGSGIRLEQVGAVYEFLDASAEFPRDESNYQKYRAVAQNDFGPAVKKLLRARKRTLIYDRTRFVR